MINLQDFITESLVQIVGGVKAAQERVAASGAKINPKEYVIQPNGSLEWNQSGFGGTNDVGQTIEFDVAVVATEEKSIKGGIGVPALGYEADKKYENSSVSHIKFSVPVFLPQQDVEIEPGESKLGDQPRQRSRWNLGDS